MGAQNTSMRVLQSKGVTMDTSLAFKQILQDVPMLLPMSSNQLEKAPENQEAPTVEMTKKPDEPKKLPEKSVSLDNPKKKSTGDGQVVARSVSKDSNKKHDVIRKPKRNMTPPGDDLDSDQDTNPNRGYVPESFSKRKAKEVSVEELDRGITIDASLPEEKHMENSSILEDVTKASETLDQPIASKSSTNN